VNEIDHEVWIEADGETVFEALTTTSGLDGWWGKAVNAEPELGYVVELDHGLGDLLRMEITELVPDEKLTWTCVSDFSDPSNPATEWRGTTLTFEVAPRETVELVGTKHDVTILRFTHAGWPPGARWQSFCNAAWGQTLSTGLKHHCEEAS
jgi:uncharacterized protein YndB with AHSA1/START domain